MLAEHSRVTNTDALADDVHWRENDLLVFDNTTMPHRRGLDAVVGERELSQSRLLRVPVQDASVHATAER